LLRDFLRTIGAACIIAGATLFFINGNSTKLEDTSDVGKLKSELQVLQSKLEKTESELVKLQTATSAAKTPAKNTTSKAEEPIKESPPEEVVKMVLLIEPGMNSSDIVDAIERSGIIADSAAFESYLNKSKLSGKIQIGKYDLDSSMTIETIAAMITK